MEKLDLHGKTYYESKILVTDFIEKNLDKLHIKIVTGNSAEMQLIVNKIIQEKASIYNDQKPIRALENFFFKIMNT